MKSSSRAAPRDRNSAAYNRIRKRGLHAWNYSCHLWMSEWNCVIYTYKIDEINNLFLKQYSLALPFISNNKTNNRLLKLHNAYGSGRWCMHIAFEWAHSVICRITDQLNVQYYEHRNKRPVMHTSHHITHTHTHIYGLGGQDRHQCINIRRHTFTQIYIYMTDGIHKDTT